MSTRMQSKSIASTVNAPSIRVPFRPNSVSKSRAGEKRITSPANDRHLITQDQSPRSALQLFVKNVTMNVTKREESESNTPQSRIAFHFVIGRGVLKRSFQAKNKRNGGENMQQILSKSNKNVPFISLSLFFGPKGVKGFALKTTTPALGEGCRQLCGIGQDKSLRPEGLSYRT
jgi:hypothetical protein